MPNPDYFTLTEFRTVPDMASTDMYPDERVLAAAAYITSIIEREVGTSFIGRTVTETLDGTARNALVLRTPYVLSVTSATVAGIATTGTLTAPGGVLRQASGDTLIGWTSGLGNVVVTYVAGYSATPPADVKEAAMQGTRAYLMETSAKARIMDRTSSITNDAGGTTSFVLAGSDRPTGYPQVDAVIIGWRDRLLLPGFA